MKTQNKEIVDALNAILTIEEILTHDGAFDNSKDDDERKAKLEKAQKTLEDIARKKDITVEQLVEKVAAIVKKIYETK